MEAGREKCAHTHTLSELAGVSSGGERSYHKSNEEPSVTEISLVHHKYT